MSMNTSDSGLVLRGDEAQGAVQVSETNWGYIVSRGRAVQRRAALGEVVAVSACLMFGTFAYAPWLLPVAISEVMLLPYKISATIMFFVFSALLYMMARRGLLAEVQVDTSRRVLRVARRNRANVATPTDTIDFGDVHSVVMKRSKTPMVMAQIVVKLTGGKSPLAVVRGPAQELEPLLRRMIADMREPTSETAGAPLVKRVRPKRVLGAFAAH